MAHSQVRERLAVTQQALEQAETELIRSKARLKGTETKAEASSAIAEARILLRRLRARSAAATLCQESLARAEQQLAQDNYGAAVFFALKAQDTAVKSQGAGPAASGTEAPAPKSRYVVRSETANIRKGPGTNEAIVGRAPSGTVLQASVVRGDGILVSWGDVSGWIHRSLVQ